MATPPRSGSAVWRGDLQQGDGELTVGDGVFSGPYTFKSRFEDGDGTNPEELIAAAHASCFAMAFSNVLAEAGTPADEVKASARVQLRILDDGPAITKIALQVEGKVPGIDEATFLQHAEAAKAGCPVSKALAGVQEITLDAKLAS
ncbi:OsmC family protein [Conexibacter sp. SYSU D00693]|uniref:OsmC family protein n=1 Tax=Conexibacter sp. SYSU D00693 TaxID=2812560 RepID=UPI00196B8621|nr:OsmC family protein [Conexibacter sp. SYSU D00693]